MCVPGAQQIIGPVVNSALGIAKTAITVKQEEKNNEYRTQLAINNIKASQEEAKRQVQLGIEQSREAKTEGIKKANLLLAQNASSNLDVGSDTALYNYSDILNSSYIEADNIKNEYNLKADSYYKKANSYLSNYYNSQANYKSSLFQTALNSLSDYPKVDYDWSVVTD